MKPTDPEIFLVGTLPSTDLLSCYEFIQIFYYLFSLCWQFISFSECVHFVQVTSLFGILLLIVVLHNSFLCSTLYISKIIPLSGKQKLIIFLLSLYNFNIYSKKLSKYLQNIQVSKNHKETLLIKKTLLITIIFDMSDRIANMLFFIQTDAPVLLHFSKGR